MADGNILVDGAERQGEDGRVVFRRAACPRDFRNAGDGAVRISAIAALDTGCVLQRQVAGVLIVGRRV
jgi:hypothetical protein